MVHPTGKYIFGTVKVGEKGQIVIPKEARDIFNIKPGDSLMILGDEKQGLAIMKKDVFLNIIDRIMSSDSSSKQDLEFADDAANVQKKEGNEE